MNNIPKIQVKQICNVTVLMFSMLGKVSADGILNYFSQKIGFDILCKLSPKEEKIRKISIINLSSAELAQRERLTFKALSQQQQVTF